MKLIAKIGIGILALIGLLVIALNIIGPSTVLDRISDCSSLVLRQTQSPSGDLIASISSSTCHDASLSGTSLYIRRAGEQSASGRQIADNSSTAFELTWLGDRTLEVSGPITSFEESLPDSIASVEIQFRMAR